MSSTQYKTINAASPENPQPSPLTSKRESRIPTRNRSLRNRSDIRSLRDSSVDLFDHDVSLIVRIRESHTGRLVEHTVVFVGIAPLARRPRRRVSEGTAVTVSITVTITFAFAPLKGHYTHLDAAGFVVSGPWTIAVLANVSMVGDWELAPGTPSWLEASLEARICRRARASASCGISELVRLSIRGVEQVKGASAERLDHLLATITTLEDELPDPVIRRSVVIGCQYCWSAIISAIVSASDSDPASESGLLAGLYSWSAISWRATLQSEMVIGSGCIAGRELPSLQRQRQGHWMIGEYVGTRG